MWRRALRVIVLTAFALQATYLVVANVLLMTPLLRWSVPKLAREQIHLNWGRAWSLWWGRVSVRRFSLQFDDSYGLQFDLNVERAEVVVSLRALAGRRFLLEHARASGVSFRGAAKVPAATTRAFPRRIAAFPPVPGYPTVAEQPAREKPPECTGAHKPAWSYELHDVALEVDELWFDEFRYRGAARVTGAFDLDPCQKVWVDAAAGFEPGTLTVGSYQVSRDVNAELELHIAPVTHDPQHPERIARATSGALRAGAELTDLGLVSVYSDHVSARAGTGRLSARVVLQQGRLTHDSTLEAELLGVEAVAHGAAVAGRATATASVDDRDKIVARASAAGSLLLPPLSSVRLRADLRDVSATARLSTDDLAAGIRFEELTARADNAAVHRAKHLARHVGLLSKLAFAKGPVTASASATVTPTTTWVQLRNVRLGAATAAGAAVKTHGRWRGAAQARIAGETVGARLVHDKVFPELFATDRWFEAQLQALGFAISRPGS